MEANILTSSVQKRKRWLLILGVVFVAANLRAPLTSVGSLIGFIRDSLQISNTLSGMLTTVPLIAFSLFSPIVPKLSYKFGMNRIIFISIICLTIGIGIRSFPSIYTLFIGTTLIGLSIAISNVLLPSLIKQQFTNKVGLMTGVYSISMNLSGAIASGISIPLAIYYRLDWTGALAVWALLSTIAIVIWFPQVRNENKTKENYIHKEKPQKRQSNIWTSKLAWSVTMFMGLQSLLFYVLVTWLPEILRPEGITLSQSGWLLSFMQLVMLPFTFIVPVIADRVQNQRLLVSITISLFLSGFFGLIYGKGSFIYLWVALLGIAIGFAFSLAMIFFSLRSSSVMEAAELSGMAQSIGYLLASIGPTLFGYLYDLTNNWTTPLFTLVFVTIVLLIVGLKAGKDEVI